MANPNADESVSFEQGSDSNQNDALSIQPVAPGEFVWDAVADRPLENLRKRTEVLRGKLEDHAFLSDYDRALILRSNAGFEFQQTALAGTSYRLNAFGSGDLWVYAALTPGRVSGGRNKGGRLFVYQGGVWVPYTGTVGVNELVLTTNADYTGQRAYADGTDLATAATLSLGANGVRVDLVANGAIPGGVGSVTAVWSGAPKRKVVITYGTAAPATTLADLIAFINADLTSGTTYGLANLFRATTTGVTSNPPTPFTGGRVQGEYDAEAFQVPQAQLTAFFNISANWLAEGEGLAIGFPAGLVETGPGAKGGRRQSLWDLPTNRVGGKAQNTAPAVTPNLFNTAREPEKIPGSIPIGKMIEGRFVFIDGTNLPPIPFTATPGDNPLKLTESFDSILRYASSVSHALCGALLIGYLSNPGTLWDNGDPFTEANVADALDAIVNQLAAEGGAGGVNSGTARLGAGELVGVASALNTALSVPASSLLNQLLALLNTSGPYGGLNTRVSEFGHFLHGVKPLEKDFTEAAPATLSNGGGVMLRAQVNRTPGTTGPLGVNKYDLASMMLQPLAIDDGGVVLKYDEPVDNGGGAPANDLRFTDAGAAARIVNVPNYIQPLITDLSGSVYAYVARLQGTGLGSVAGYYLVVLFDTVNTRIRLKALDGSDPDFSTADFTGATLTVFTATLHGNDRYSRRVRMSHVGIAPMAHLAVVAPDSEFLRTTATTGVAATPAKTHAIYKANKVIFHPGDTGIGAQSIEKRTESILIPNDYDLLKGKETGTPVTATLNHHHASDYTETRFTSGQPLLVALAALHDVDSGTATEIDLPDPGVGRVLKGCIVQIRVTATSASGGVNLGHLFALLSTDAGGAQPIGNVSIYVSEVGTGTVINRIDVHYTIPVSAARKFWFTPTIVNLAAPSVVAVNVYHVASIVGFV